MQIVEVTDITGRKRKVDLGALDAKQFAKDGDKASFSIMCMDCDGGLLIVDSEQLKGHDNMPNDITDAEKRVNDAYHAMCGNLDYRTRNKTHKPGETTTQAYDEARHNLENAWRGGR